MFAIKNNFCKKTKNKLRAHLESIFYLLLDIRTFHCQKALLF